jgi:signal peptidase I
MIRGYESISVRRKKDTSKAVFYFILKIIVITTVLYFIITNFFLVSFQIKSISMEPNLEQEERILASPFVYGISLPFSDFRGISKPSRGDLIVITPPYYTEDLAIQTVFDPVIRFFTFQSVNPVKDKAGKDIGRFIVKRIIGIPGDTVKMNQFMAYIMPKNKESFYLESEIIPIKYFIKTDNKVDGWEEKFPFSGKFEEIILKEDEYFVLGDNRPFSSDSRSWGIVPYDQIIGKVIFRYWPLEKFGSL